MVIKLHRVRIVTCAKRIIFHHCRRRHSRCRHVVNLFSVTSATLGHFSATRLRFP